MANPTLPVDAGAVLADLQQQLDELRRTVAAQQDTIDELVAAQRRAPGARNVGRR